MARRRLQLTRRAPQGRGCLQASSQALYASSQKRRPPRPGRLRFSSLHPTRPAGSGEEPLNPGVSWIDPGARPFAELQDDSSAHRPLPTDTSVSSSSDTSRRRLQDSRRDGFAAPYNTPGCPGALWRARDSTRSTFPGLRRQTLGDFLRGDDTTYERAVC